jgi:hypothetical protein
MNLTFWLRGGLSAAAVLFRRAHRSRPPHACCMRHIAVGLRIAKRAHRSGASHAIAATRQASGRKSRRSESMRESLRDLDDETEKGHQ